MSLQNGNSRRVKSETLCIRNESDISLLRQLIQEIIREECASPVSDIPRDIRLVILRIDEKHRSIYEKVERIKQRAHKKEKEMDDLGNSIAYKSVPLAGVRRLNPSDIEKEKEMDNNINKMKNHMEEICNTIDEMDKQVERMRLSYDMFF